MISGRGNPIHTPRCVFVSSAVVAMVRLSKTILGVVAVSLTFGAAQFASGGDLRTGAASPTESATSVNRAGKADRSAIPLRSISQTPTVSIRSSTLADTSIAFRLPASARVGANSSNGETAKVPARRSAIACEPVVSVLTEVAKLLQPGRCVT